MESADIKGQVDTLVGMVHFVSDHKHKARMAMISCDKEIQLLAGKIRTLQSKCEHVFPGVNTVMGRGICTVCGKSDY